VEIVHGPRKERRKRRKRRIILIIIIRNGAKTILFGRLNKKWSKNNKSPKLSLGDLIKMNIIKNFHIPFKIDEMFKYINFIVVARLVCGGNPSTQKPPI
jgi:hypothetical protein